MYTTALTEHRLLSHTYTLEAVSSLKAHSSFQRHKIKKYKQRLETWDTGAIPQDSAVGHVLPVPLYTLGSMLGYKTCLWHFPGGPVVKTVFPMQGTRVPSLVGELDPKCCNLRSCVPQLRPGVAK